MYLFYSDNSVPIAEIYVVEEEGNNNNNNININKTAEMRRPPEIHWQNTFSTANIRCLSSYFALIMFTNNFIFSVFLFFCVCWSDGYGCLLLFCLLLACLFLEFPSCFYIYFPQKNNIQYNVYSTHYRQYSGKQGWRVDVFRVL